MQLNVMPLNELLTTANNYAASIKELGIYSDLVKELCNRLDAGSLARREITKQRDALAAENAMLKANLMFWDADDPEIPYEHPDEIASEYDLDADTVFDVQVAARLPDRKYRVVTMTDDECRTEQVSNGHIQTPATDAYLSELRAQGAESAAAHIKQHIQHIPDDLRVTYHDAIELCSGAAAELRKGGAA